MAHIVSGMVAGSSQRTPRAHTGTLWAAVATARETRGALRESRRQWSAGLHGKD
jgi:hypothetical protein